MIFPNMGNGVQFTFTGEPFVQQQQQQQKEVPVDFIDAETIYIKYISDIERLEQKTNSDWIDLRAAETIELKKGEFKLIPLGVAMQLPKGYEAVVVPRSSTFKTWGLIQTNSMGVIDESYCGASDQWMMPVYATRDVQINKNDRICQFRIIAHQPSVTFIESDLNGNDSRGGFGSTGRR